MSESFYWSNRNKLPNGRWGTFYYCDGMGFNRGQKVYYGKNEWNTEQAAIEAQERWENGKPAIQ